MRQQIDEFFAAGGDRLRTEGLPLHPHTTVLDLGGYVGGWANRIHELYGSTVHVFEPVVAFAERIRDSVPEGARIFVYPYGLGPRTERVRMNMSGDGTSVSAGDENGDALIVRLEDFLREVSPRADLTKINIEGSEYDLLDHAIETGLAENLGDIVVQFHKHVPDAERRLLTIRRGLEATHDLRWSYDFVWEYWALKEGKGGSESTMKNVHVATMRNELARTRSEVTEARAAADAARHAYYHVHHAVCPKCGATGHSSTYAGFIMDVSNPGAYKDMNDTRCSGCGHRCTMHERISADEWAAIKPPEDRNIKA